jgi:hypothetical protein
MVSKKALIEVNLGKLLGRGFCNDPAIQILIRIKACFGCIRTRGDRLKPEKYSGAIDRLRP